jgi:tetratricopeptide (TPR) repeat protein
MLRYVFIASLLAFALSLAYAPGEAPAAGSSSSALKEDSNYKAGVRAVKAQNWEEAIVFLTKVVAKDAKNADAQNWLGFSYRKLGDYDQAFAYYKSALGVNPRHKGAHEYIGEAYLETDNMAKAEEHLATLDDICVFSCDEYQDLKKAIAEHKKVHNIGS